jgi:hypothetical protein
VGQYEDAIFQKRMRELRRQKERIQRQKHDKQQVGNKLPEAAEQAIQDTPAASGRSCCVDMVLLKSRQQKQVARDALDVIHSCRLGCDCSTMFAMRGRLTSIQYLCSGYHIAVAVPTWRYSHWQFMTWTIA